MINKCVSVSRSEVKERVVWVDTKKTQVKNKAGKLKEKETTILEVILKCSHLVLENKKGDAKCHQNICFPLVGASESPEARRQAAPGGPVQHRGSHRPLLLPHRDEYSALEAQISRFGFNLC